MPSFGEELKRERELRGITLREVAEATKINLRYLEALERNDFEHLPGGVFNRGFVRAYSQFIGVEPDAMVDAYTLEERAQGSKGKAKDRDSFHRPNADGFERAGAAAPLAGRAAKPRSALLKWLLIALAVAVVATGAALIYLELRGGAVPPETPPAAEELRTERSGQ